MADLHKLVISAPDGLGHNATLTLDGQPVYASSVTLRCNASEVVSAVIEIDPVIVEFDGMADVVAKLIAETPA